MKEKFLFLLFQFFSFHCSSQVSVQDLLLENQPNPTGVDIKIPRFSWVLISDNRNVRQTAYEIQVSSSPNSQTVVWNSGKVSSEQSVHIPYKGNALQSGKKYYWQVRVWDNLGNASAWSPPAFWQTALLYPADWKASWIQAKFDTSGKAGPSAHLRKQFSIKKNLQSATVYITAHGLYEAMINGQRVGDAYLMPGWTSYNKHLQYQTYDVTGLLLQGKNAVGVTLGDGWYRGSFGWDQRRNNYGKDRSLLFQLVMNYTDGSTETIVSDNSWKASTGEIIYSELYNGETIDARLAKKGWANPDYDDRNWKGVQVNNFVKNNLVANYNEPIKKHETFKPIKILTTPKGEQVLDFGQNLVGWVQVKLKGRAGDTIRLSHAEVLDKEGNLYFENLRSAKAQDNYILKGDGIESFEPHFTFHGFRFVRVEGLKEKINPDNFTAIALYSDMPPIGEFECSNAMVNQLQKNIQWGQRGNFLDVPTDCPQRDERMGWTGDAQVFSRTAAYNFNVNSFFAKWLRDITADQKENGSIPFIIPQPIRESFLDKPIGAAGWSDAGIIIPWNMYVVYGDRRIVEEQYPSMKSYLSYVRHTARKDLWDTGFQWGDWLSFKVDETKEAFEAKSAFTNKYLVAQSFFAYNTELMIKAAKLLGKTEDVKDFEALLNRIKTAFQNEYMTLNGRLISETQTAYVLALQFDILPEKFRQQAVERLVDNIKSYRDHLTTGFLGTPFLTHVLTRFGKTDLAYKLLLQDTYPSWLYPVKMGATTIWERWDSMKPDSSFADPGMTSFNHYAYGAVGDWIYRTVAGIDTKEEGAGYKEIIIKPHPGGGLTNARGSLKTYYGKLSSDWKVNNGNFILDVEIPCNTTASVYIPAIKADDISGNGKSLTASKEIQITGKEGDYVVLKLGSGKYQFRVRK